MVNSNDDTLRAIEDVSSHHTIDISRVVDTHQQTHWNKCQMLLDEVKEFVSKREKRLASPKPYDFRRGQLVGCVKRSLINAKSIEQHRFDRKVEDAIRRYKGSRGVLPVFQN
jgi:hypothetical protein